MAEYNAAELAAKLSALKFFPSHPSGILVIAEILEDLAPTPELAERVVETTVAECDEWPGPKTFRAMAQTVVREFGGRPAKKAPDPNCRKCRGVGRIETHGGLHPASKRCDCWRVRQPTTTT